MAASFISILLFHLISVHDEHPPPMLPPLSPVPPVSLQLLDCHFILWLEEHFLFLHNTIQELDILYVEEVMECSEDSWVVQVCLEEVQTCEANIVKVAEYVVLTVWLAFSWRRGTARLL